MLQNDSNYWIWILKINIKTIARCTSVCQPNCEKHISTIITQNKCAKKMNFFIFCGWLSPVFMKKIMRIMLSIKSEHNRIYFPYNQFGKVLNMMALLNSTADQQKRCLLEFNSAFELVNSRVIEMSNSSSLSNSTSIIGYWILHRKMKVTDYCVSLSCDLIS